MPTWMPNGKVFSPCAKASDLSHTRRASSITSCAMRPIGGNHKTRRGIPMSPKKTLAQRQKELQALLATPAGREELQALGARYHPAGANVRPRTASIITYILVYERARGLICE